MIIFDLDGTLANIEHRRHLVTGDRSQWKEFFEECHRDTPNVPVVKLFHTLYMAHRGTLEIWSGRSSSVRSKTVNWLTENVFFGTEMWKDPKSLWHVPLRMRPEGDHQSDVTLKEQWLREALEEGKAIDLVVDDRKKVVNMWRRNGITCLQCAEGDF